MTEGIQRYRVFAEWGEGLAGASKTVRLPSAEQALEEAHRTYPGAQVSVMPYDEWAREHAQMAQRLEQREQLHPYPAVADDCVLPHVEGFRQRMDMGR